MLLIMAENEMKEEVEIVTEVSENETEENLDDITYEQALAWKKEADELRSAKSKAEAKIVELKKSGKSAPASEEGWYTRMDAKIDKFIAKNPSLEGYESELRAYLDKGVDIEEAKILVENKDKSIKARAQAERASISGSEGSHKSLTVYTAEMLDSLSQTEYNRAMGLIESGKARRG